MKRGRRESLTGENEGREAGHEGGQWGAGLLRNQACASFYACSEKTDCSEHTLIRPTTAGLTIVLHRRNRDTS